MVCTLGLDDQRATGAFAGNADCPSGEIRTILCENGPICKIDPLHKSFGKLDHEWAWLVEDHAFFPLPGNGFLHFGMLVAMKDCPETAHEVYPFVPVDILKPTALRPFAKMWKMSGQTGCRGNVSVNTARNDFQGALEKLI